MPRNHTTEPLTPNRTQQQYRTCLSCNNRFMSAGPYNRICPDCTTANRSQRHSDRQEVNRKASRQYITPTKPNNAT